MSGIVPCGMAYGVGVAVAGIFAAVSALHIYWALGGTVGLEAAIPEQPAKLGAQANDRAFVKALHPSVAMTLVVAGALALVCALASVRAGLFAPSRDNSSLRWCLAAIALILTARAVGDLNLVGFFKQIRGTRFAIMDTWLYSPLCIFLALGLLLLAFSTGCRL